MKKHTYHIICAWALLFCFIAGQYMVYAHQHHVNKQSHMEADAGGKHHSSSQVLKEKCEICDSMHHSFMELVKPQFAFYNANAGQAYLLQLYQFESIGLILSSGRAPPSQA
ncbi:hypothetical protein CKK33_02930 [Mucilaginibacter sp. MD40]|uniref:hypothetical protein n=1 Tax=Mucilaginibacter sp. MD40 TaxID=2029590 RepID=UPI000BDB61FA|nr:hypothetical protein [Mucilaginibacter sp. MD40]PAW92505.1 hypothetical protein CKK33_02930 [Mucilaginibacter sp. MD40]